MSDRKPIRRNYHIPAGRVEFHAVAVPGTAPCMKINYFPVSGRPSSCRITRANAHAVALAVAAGTMPVYAFADWLEELGMSAFAEQMRHPETVDQSATEYFRPARRED